MPSNEYYNTDEGISVLKEMKQSIDNLAHNFSQGVNTLQQGTERLVSSVSSGYNTVAEATNRFMSGPVARTLGTVQNTFSREFNAPAHFGRDLAVLFGREPRDMTSGQANYFAKEHWNQRLNQAGNFVKDEALGWGSFFAGSALTSATAAGIPGGIAAVAAYEIAKGKLFRDPEEMYRYKNIINTVGLDSITSEYSRDKIQGVGFTSRESTDLSKWHQDIIKEDYKKTFKGDEFELVLQAAGAGGYYKELKGVEDYKRRTQELFKGTKEVMKTLHMSLEEAVQVMNDVGKMKIPNAVPFIRKVGTASAFTGMSTSQITNYAEKVGDQMHKTLGVSKGFASEMAVGSLASGAGTYGVNAFNEFASNDAFLLGIMGENGKIDKDLLIRSLSGEGDDDVLDIYMRGANKFSEMFASGDIFKWQNEKGKYIESMGKENAPIIGMTAKYQQFKYGMKQTGLWNPEVHDEYFKSTLSEEDLKVFERMQKGELLPSMEGEKLEYNATKNTPWQQTLFDIKNFLTPSYTKTRTEAQYKDRVRAIKYKIHKDFADVNDPKNAIMMNEYDQFRGNIEKGDAGKNLNAEGQAMEKELLAVMPEKSEDLETSDIIESIKALSTTNSKYAKNYGRMADFDNLSNTDRMAMASVIEKKYGKEQALAYFPEFGVEGNTGYGTKRVSQDVLRLRELEEKDPDRVKNFYKTMYRTSAGLFGINKNNLTSLSQMDEYDLVWSAIESGESGKNLTAKGLTMKEELINALPSEEDGPIDAADVMKSIQKLGASGSSEYSKNYSRMARFDILSDTERMAMASAIEEKYGKELALDMFPKYNMKDITGYDSTKYQKMVDKTRKSVFSDVFKDKKFKQYGKDERERIEIVALKELASHDLTTGEGVAAYQTSLAKKLTTDEEVGDKISDSYATEFAKQITGGMLVDQKYKDVNVSWANEIDKDLKKLKKTDEMMPGGAFSYDVWRGMQNEMEAMYTLLQMSIKEMKEHHP